MEAAKLFVSFGICSLALLYYYYFIDKYSAPVSESEK